MAAHDSPKSKVQIRQVASRQPNPVHVELDTEIAEPFSAVGVDGMHSLGREEHDASGLHPFAGIVAGHKNGPFLQINDLHKIVPVGFHGR